MTDIGKLQRLPLREVWRHEAHNFTRWLTDNIDVLSEVLPTELMNPRSEQAAGSFSVDILAEDEAGNFVIIENQLEKSDHDHLGKLITYLTAFDAKRAVWVVSEPRPEHIQAISWLNESTDASFHLLKVEAIRIGDSPPAPLFTEIVGPSEESRQVGEFKRDLAEKEGQKYKFWSALLDEANQKTELHARISPGHKTWIGTSKAGFQYNYVVWQHSTRVELYIDRGKGAEEKNERILSQLEQHKPRIEEVFGDTLEWQRLEGKRANRIAKTLVHDNFTRRSSP